jgi:hypothetical protein
VSKNESVSSEQLAPPETGWLIESTDPPLMYWRAPGDWCTNPSHATRFCRQTDADMVASTIDSMGPIRTTEHSWG